MNRISVLGAGMVGSAIARDLNSEAAVTIYDINEDRLKHLKEKYNIEYAAADLTSQSDIKKAAAGADLVIGAVPGFMGYNVFKTVIESGVNIVDISFFPEDPLPLSQTAEENGVTALFDCGVAPGLSNLILGYYNSFMKVNSFRCLVGGLPFYKAGPLQYKAPFSPKDVIEEYTRPARIKEKGEIIVKPALTDVEHVEIKPVGTLEAFNTDGLRSLLTTMDIPDMVEKTLRYPGHTAIIRGLRDLGFFSSEPQYVNGTAVSPIDLSEKILFNQWRLEPGEPEFTVMQVVIKGVEEGVKKEYIFTLFDEYEPKTDMSSMARTTGFTCAAAARLVLSGKYDKPGVSAPEHLGAQHDCFKSVIDDLKERSVLLNRLINVKSKNNSRLKTK